MHRARCFSTSVHHAAQPLFKQIERPLTKQQLKAKHKEILKTQPNYSPGLQKTMMQYLYRHTRTPNQVEARVKLRKQLQTIVRERFGDRYDVRDISTHHYARDISVCPPEFAIVDLNRPAGLSLKDLDYDINTSQGIDLPEAYNPTLVAAALTDQGHNGYFEDQFGIQDMPVEDHEIDKKLWTSWQTPWPHYLDTLYLSKSIVYPVKLTATTNPQFTLMTASPLPSLLVRLVQAYSTSIKGLPELISLVQLWARSWGIHGLSPMCIALMVIRSLQADGLVPSIQTSKSGHALVSSLFDATYPTPADHPLVNSLVPTFSEGSQRWRWSVYPTDVAFIDPPQLTVLDKVHRAFVAFMQYWSDTTIGSGKSFKKRLESIRDNTTVNSRWITQQERISSGEPLPDALTLDSRTSGHFVDFKHRRRLYVLDPFALTFNHAATLNHNMLTRFLQSALYTRKRLTKEDMFRNVIGPEPVDTGAMHLAQAKDSTSSARSTVVEGYDAELEPDSLLLAREIVFKPAPRRPSKDGVSYSDEEAFTDHRVPRYTLRPKTTYSPYTGRYPPSPRPSSSRPATFARSVHTSAATDDSTKKLPAERSPVMSDKDKFALARSLSLAPEHIVDARIKLVRKVQGAIQKAFGDQYTVSMFGSAYYGMDSEKSDVDLVVFDPEHKRGWVKGIAKKPLPAIYNMKKVAKVLRPLFSDVRHIEATVPILKFTDPQSGVACDLNINERLGFLNSDLIRHYCLISPLCRDVAVRIKRWAKPLGLNDSAGKHGPRTFSSYALTIMTIAFFQHMGMLPNLQGELPTLRGWNRHVFWAPLSIKRKKWVVCDVRFARITKWTSPRTLTCDQATLRWFRYFGKEHNYEEDIVSIRDGGIVPRVPKGALESEGPDEDEEDGTEKVEIEEDEVGPSVFLNKRTAAVPDEAEPEASEEPTEASVTEKCDKPDKLGGMDHQQYTDMLDRSDWHSHPLAVADPFIGPKNLAKPLDIIHVERFRIECARMADAMKAGKSFDELVSDLELEYGPTKPGLNRAKRRALKRAQTLAKADTTALNTLSKVVRGALSQSPQNADAEPVEEATEPQKLVAGGNA